MLTTRTNRIDPSLFSGNRMADVAEVFARPGRAVLFDRGGRQIELPAPLIEHFARIVRLIQDGKAVVFIPEEDAFTTQAAANYLGMSRQHLVNLLEKGVIPHHKVGTHRRVTFKDLLAYENQRDQIRHEALNRLSAAVDQAGLYDPGHAAEP